MGLVISFSHELPLAGTSVEKIVLIRQTKSHSHRVRNLSPVSDCKCEGLLRKASVRPQLRHRHLSETVAARRVGPAEANPVGKSGMIGVCRRDGADSAQCRPEVCVTT